jgi:hypothetical protein
MNRNEKINFRQSENDLSGTFNQYLMYLGRNIVKTTFVGIAIGLLVYTVALFLFEATKIAGGRHHINYDSKMISALQNISNFVPAREVIVTPNFTPIVMLFTGHKIFTPYKETPYTSLVNQMNQRNYSYLLVFENQSEIPGLIKVFTKDELPKLSKDFKEIATYVTNFSKLHLYKRIT